MSPLFWPCWRGHKGRTQHAYSSTCTPVLILLVRLPVIELSPAVPALKTVSSLGFGPGYHSALSMIAYDPPKLPLKGQTFPQSVWICWDRSGQIVLWRYDNRRSQPQTHAHGRSSGWFDWCRAAAEEEEESRLCSAAAAEWRFNQTKLIHTRNRSTTTVSSCSCRTSHFFYCTVM